ncbi:hypothetical protein GOODEAATRI_020254 [Goodea atripinnis]|uniref:Uncharacterized protein n=1 Tax=Goodea atripinnis TaxID=208336 RepID=A0ABV0NLT1_9TELE
MNLALIHDRLHIKSFWENRISADNQHADTEEQRMNKSALRKSVRPHLLFITAVMMFLCKNVCACTQMSGDHQLRTPSEPHQSLANSWVTVAALT